MQSADTLQGPSDAREELAASVAGAGNGAGGLAEVVGTIELTQEPELELIQLLHAGGDAHIVEHQVLACAVAGGGNAAFEVETGGRFGREYFFGAEIEAQGRGCKFKA
jgi:hypothetical protein